MKRRIENVTYNISRIDSGKKRQYENYNRKDSIK